MDAAAFGGLPGGGGSGASVMGEAVGPAVQGAVDGLGAAEGETAVATSRAIQPYWPANRGFMGPATSETLSPGR